MVASRPAPLTVEFLSAQQRTAWCGSAVSNASAPSDPVLDLREAPLLLAAVDGLDRSGKLSGCDPFVQRVGRSANKLGDLPAIKEPDLI
ncbi:MAG TPA: hypothetical protein VH678_03905 [Xanthobacteraceae bacterium]|jgi:hypothetical protein